ncbi:MAG: DNA-directed RNA polymerase subunit omega [Spartobacteria bacterium]
MNNLLIKAASEVITEPKMLINVISRRVRQLAFGHRPLVACAPGTGLADVALTEVIERKLTFEAEPVIAEVVEAVVLPFPSKTKSRKKAA